MITGVSRALVWFGESNGQEFQSVATWPKSADSFDQLEQAAIELLKNGNDEADSQTSVRTDFDTSSIIASPIQFNGQWVGAVVVDVSERSAAQQEAVKKLLLWGTLWFHYAVQQQTKNSPSQRSFLTLFKLFASCLEHQSFQGSATAVVTELAAALNCTRVSLGFVHGERVRVCALSHSAKIDDQANQIRLLGAAMEESIDQDDMIIYPSGDTVNVRITKAHEELAGPQQDGAICTIPLLGEKKITGAITLERNNGPFDQSTVELCQQFMALAGPLLDLKRRDDRWIITKLFNSVKSLAIKIFGAENLTLKFVTASILSIFLLLVFTDDHYNVTADARLEGRIQRAVVAPITGFIAEAHYRAGDIVKKAEVMGQLDDKDMLLESAKWVGQEQQLLREYRQALAGHDRAKVNILSAKIEQANAQIELINKQLERTKIRAPFDGVVIEGDLSQALGSPVERGDVLFKVAPLSEYRLILNIDERDITDINNNQTGALILAGLPTDQYQFSVTNITPVSTADDGHNFFRVEADLNATSKKLRPGMEGIAKVSVGNRQRLWIWSHKIVDWFRLWAWKYIP